MKNRNYDHLFKFVIVGNSAVGKSAIFSRFTEDTFNENFLSTIGVDFKFKTIKLGDKNIKLQIWDTAGQCRFRTITNTYYKSKYRNNIDADCVFLVYDITNPASF
jgi:Ras-related protein Rab-1A